MHSDITRYAVAQDDSPAKTMKKVSLTSHLARRDNEDILDERSSKTMGRLRSQRERFDEKHRQFHEFIYFGDVGGGPVHDHSLQRTHAHPHQPEPARGFLVSHQSVIFAVWMGVAVFALVAANLYQWHSRRLLSQSQRDVSSLADRRLPTAEAVDGSISRIAS